MLDKSNLNQTLVISGDRHRGGIYKIKTYSRKTISEVTSSSLNASFPNKEEFGPLRVGDTFTEENYGVIIVDSKKNTMFTSIKNINGEIVRNVIINN